MTAEAGEPCSLPKNFCPWLLPVVMIVRRSNTVKFCRARSWEAYRFAPDLIEPVCMAGLVNLNGDLYCERRSPLSSNIAVFQSRQDTHKTVFAESTYLTLR